MKSVLVLIVSLVAANVFAAEVTPIQATSIYISPTGCNMDETCFPSEEYTLVAKYNGKQCFDEIAVEASDAGMTKDGRRLIVLSAVSISTAKSSPVGCEVLPNLTFRYDLGAVSPGEVEVHQITEVQ